MRKLKNEELKRPSVEEFKNKKKIPLVVVLDNVRSLNNVGAAFRTSDAFLVEKIYLCGITGTPPHRDINKTALGSTESVSWEYVEEAVELANSLKEEGYKILCVEQVEDSVMLQDFIPSPSSRYCLVFGNEISGISEDLIALADVCLEIPQFGTKHSLNIAVSMGIVLWTLFSKMKL